MVEAVDAVLSQGQAQTIGPPTRTSTPSKPSGSLGKRHLCQECGKSYKYASGLTEHRRQEHGFQTGSRYTCGVCDKAFMNITEFHSHYIGHQGIKPHRCKKCNKYFQSKRNLTRHNCKTKPRLLVCSKCGKSFACARLLSQHMHTHDEKPQLIHHCPNLMLVRPFCSRPLCIRQFCIRRLCILL